MHRQNSAVRIAFAALLLITMSFAFSACTQTPAGANIDSIQSIEELADRILSAASKIQPQNRPRPGFVGVRGNEFILDGKAYRFVGINFWQAMNLASEGPGGNRELLLQELDFLHAKGIDNLRIICASEGPDTEPYRVVPSLMPEPGVYNPDLLDGLDYLLKAMSDRNMKAIMVLGNMWQWSGGFGQHIAWSGAGSSIPYPVGGVDWNTYMQYLSRFYSGLPSVARYLQHARFIITRYNQYTRRYYYDEPAIMAWELANEPRPGDAGPAYLKWVEYSSSFIKLLDRNHLVTTGSEGDIAGPDAFLPAHNFPHIDYTTVHLWVQNWGWYNPKKMNDKIYNFMLNRALGYLERHVGGNQKTSKPIVLEEFGLARDNNDYDPSSPVTWRDRFFRDILDYVYKAAGTKKGMCGANLWAWSGGSRPVSPGGPQWKPGDPLLGDPPHEPQGWYGIYDTDVSTLAIISEYAEKMRNIR